MSSIQKILLEIYDRMLETYGSQNWWPAESRFEVMVGAILTQAVSWKNADRAISSLKLANVMSPKAIRKTSSKKLANLIYSAGYHNEKALKLKALAEYLGKKFGDSIEQMSKEPSNTIRSELLAIYGIGKETADDILLYALDQPVFVIDTITKRLLSRVGIAKESGSYEYYQSIFTTHLNRNLNQFNEFHALIDHHGSTVCRKQYPICAKCCLIDICSTGKMSTQYKK